MKLSKAKINTKCVIKSVCVKNEKIKFRLMELGLVENCQLIVFKKSVLKKTLLIDFAHSRFTLKENLANEIEVEYA